MNIHAYIDYYTFMYYVVAEAEKQKESKNIKNFENYKNCHCPRDYYEWLKTFKTEKEIIKEVANCCKTTFTIHISLPC